MGSIAIFSVIISMSIFGIMLYWGSILYSYIFSRQGRNLNSRDYYECGFKSVPDSRLPIDINFSAAGLIFLIYEMEIVLFVPIMLNWFGLPIALVVLTLLSLSILGVSYWYEWEHKIFNWVF